MTNDERGTDEATPGAWSLRQVAEQALETYEELLDKATGEEDLQAINLWDSHARTVRAALGIVSGPEGAGSVSPRGSSLADGVPESAALPFGAAPWLRLSCGDWGDPDKVEINGRMYDRRRTSKATMTEEQIGALQEENRRLFLENIELRAMNGVLRDNNERLRAEAEQRTSEATPGVLTAAEIAEYRRKGPDAPYSGGNGIYALDATRILDSHEALRAEVDRLRRNEAVEPELYVTAPAQCEAVSPDGIHSCTATRGHEGVIHVETDPMFGLPRMAWVDRLRRNDAPFRDPCHYPGCHGGDGAHIAECPNEPEQRRSEAIPEVRVIDLAGDGTGPWRLMVGEYGVCQFPSVSDPKTYALESKRVLETALARRERAKP